MQYALKNADYTKVQYNFLDADISLETGMTPGTTQMKGFKLVI